MEWINSLNKLDFFTISFNQVAISIHIRISAYTLLKISKKSDLSLLNIWR